jgi:hypothetical protein
MGRQVVGNVVTVPGTAKVVPPAETVVRKIAALAAVYVCRILPVPIALDRVANTPYRKRKAGAGTGFGST